MKGQLKSQLPNVTIDYGNGALGQAIASADGLLCLVAVGAAKVEKDDKNQGFNLGDAVALNRFDDLTHLGVNAQNNPLLYAMVQDFYAEALEGTKVYIVGYDKDDAATPADLLMADVLDPAKNYLTSVIKATNGEIRGICISSSRPTPPPPPASLKDDPTPQNGLDPDVKNSLQAAQKLGEWSTESCFAPLFVLIDGIGSNVSIEKLDDLTANQCNRVGVVVGAHAANSFNQAIGLVAGRIAGVGVQRNIGRVQDGSVNANQLFVFDKSVETADVASVYAKGYITFRTITGLSGYFIVDDRLAATDTDDYRQLTNRRVIDKAYRIAYAVLVQKLLDEVPVKKDGTIVETYAAAFEMMVVNAIATNMTNNGELSVDPSDSSDRGCECVVNRTKSIVADSTIEATLRVRPFGYSKFITVTLGFQINNK